MSYLVLGIGYAEQDREAERREWQRFGIDFHFADNISQAVSEVSFNEYVCIAVCADSIEAAELTLLHSIKSIPIIVLPTPYTMVERQACAYLSVMQYLRVSGNAAILPDDGDNIVRRYLDLPNIKREALTIITVKDLSFCLEYRSVEVRGIRCTIYRCKYSDTNGSCCTNKHGR